MRNLSQRRAYVKLAVSTSMKYTLREHEIMRPVQMIFCNLAVKLLLCIQSKN